MKQSLDEDDERYLVFLAMVNRVEEFVEPVSLRIRDLTATPRELAMLSKGDWIADDRYNWWIIEKDKPASRLSVVPEDRVSPMNAYYAMHFGSGVEDKTTMINWAVEGLLAGLSGQEIAALAGADFESSQDVRWLFEAAIKEQNFAQPTMAACLSWREAAIGLWYRVGQINIDDALRQLNLLYYNSDYDQRYLAWNNFAEHYGSLVRGDRYIYEVVEGLTLDNANEFLRHDIDLVLRGP